MAGIFQSGVFSMGFDMDPTAAQAFDTSSGSSASNANTPYSFGYAWSVGTSSQKNFNTNLVTHFNNIKVYIPTLPTAATGNIIFEWLDITASGVQLSLRVLPGGVLQFYLGSGTGTTVGSASAAGAVSAGVWFTFETKVIIAASSGGTVQCKINGSSVIASSSVTTQNTANTWTNAILLNQASISGNTVYDDWVMLDSTGSSPFNTYLGPVQVRGEKPNANSAVGGRNAWTPTNPTNVNYTNVGNIPASASEYNADSTAGDYDMFRFPSLPANVATVLAVNEWALVGLDSAGARTVELDCYSNGTDSPGSAFTPSPIATPTYYNLVQTVDPHTSSAWTVANAGAAELGVKVQT